MYFGAQRFCRGHRRSQIWMWKQRREKHTPPPLKENHLENFSGLKEKLSRPVVESIDIKYKNQESHIYHRNLSSVAPIAFGKERFLTGAGRCMRSALILGKFYACSP